MVEGLNFKRGRLILVQAIFLESQFIFSLFRMLGSVAKKIEKKTRDLFLGRLWGRA